MTAQEIRQKFFDFFEKKGHKIVASAPIVVKDDPTLMFTNAGMNQFKDVFLGSKEPEASRVADTQKCLRVSGKHNDLEEVGRDTYHHTMFEMLGNWSFGDPDGRSRNGQGGYFKAEAIAWAWELLTEVYGIEKDRLYVTIFEGDQSDGVEEDKVAYEEWAKHIDKTRILRGNKKDNFWEMGDTGPCGPCSEIHVDTRSDADRKKVDGTTLVNADDPEVIELWNLVFIQYNRKTDGVLENLPARHVDTGMGLERLVRTLQGKNSNYDTDLFTPYIKALATISGKQYGQDEEIDIAFRVIADHIRAIGFTIADGQLPSNTGAGYVVRRVLRRAVRYGYSYLHLKEPFLYKLISVWAEQFGHVFPEVENQREFAAKVVLEEEHAFLKTLENGLKRFAQMQESQSKDESIPGHFVFELYDTYGFPVDLTRLIANERGFTVDEHGFEAQMKQQKERSRAATAVEAGDWVNVQAASQVRFVGYDRQEADARVLKFRKVSQKKKDLFQVVLDETPFYAESGGQIGDTGVLEASGSTMKVLDTKKENELIVHLVDRLPDEMPETVHAKIDTKRRRATAANHSATHLLHAALRKVLGKHVEQKGSYVGPDRLRFDFSHFEKVSDDQLRVIERMVNEKIWQNISRGEESEVPIDEAIEKGAMHLFGEKYGDKVRVITFDPTYSIELCGGTHVEATGQIGLCKIVSESAIAAGVRRIEAVTAEGAYDYVNKFKEQVEQVMSLTKNTQDVVKGVESLQNENKKLSKELEQLQSQQVQATKQSLMQKAIELGDATLIAETMELPSANALKELAFALKGEVKNLFLVIGARIDGKPMLSIAISEVLIKDYDLHAGNLIREAATHIQGGGGGQPFYATAGGKNIDGLQAAVDHVVGVLKAKELQG